MATHISALAETLTKGHAKLHRWVARVYCKLRLVFYMYCNYVSILYRFCDIQRQVIKVPIKYGLGLSKVTEHGTIR